MNHQYLTHWIIGICATLTWFWGDKAGIPQSAINLAAWIVPGLLAHALGSSVSNSATAPQKPAADVKTEPMWLSAEPVVIPDTLPGVQS